MPDAPITFLAAAPATLPEGECPTSRIQIAKTGKFRDHRYGRFAITHDDFTAWKRNLSLVGGRVLVDMDHRSEKGISSEAAGWITALDSQGSDGETPTPDELWATVEWTPPGAQAVRDRRYLYISPAYGAFRDDSGALHKNVLQSVALTNRPFLGGMAAVTLSREDVFAETDDAPEASDSRDQMPDLKKIAEALKLEAGADEAKVLEAIGALGTQPTKLEDATVLEFQLGTETIKVTGKDLKRLTEGGDTKTLDQLAEVDGKVVLDKATVDALTSGAEAGQEARKELSDMKFAACFDKALDEGRIDAKPETRETFHALYQVKPDDTLKTLDGLQKIVNTEAKGKGGGEGIDDAEVPEGVDEESFRLDREVKAYQAEHDEDDYSVALHKVLDSKKVAA